MRLRDYSTFFPPEEFDALTDAYDAAWRDLWTKRLTLPPEKQSGADHSGFCLQREAGRRPAERDCIARRFRPQLCPSIDPDRFAPVLGISP